MVASPLKYVGNLGGGEDSQNYIEEKFGPSLKIIGASNESPVSELPRPTSAVKILGGTLLCR